MARTLVAAYRPSNSVSDRIVGIKDFTGLTGLKQDSQDSNQTAFTS
jgi:hypothetical protein